MRVFGLFILLFTVDRLLLVILNETFNFERFNVTLVDEDSCYALIVICQYK
jgi:hypothetical protein